MTPETFLEHLATLTHEQTDAVIAAAGKSNVWPLQLEAWNRAMKMGDDHWRNGLTVRAENAAIRVLRRVGADGADIMPLAAQARKAMVAITAGPALQATYYDALVGPLGLAIPELLVRDFESGMQALQAVTDEEALTELLAITGGAPDPERPYAAGGPDHSEPWVPGRPVHGTTTTQATEEEEPEMPKKSATKEKPHPETTRHKIQKRMSKKQAAEALSKAAAHIKDAKAPLSPAEVERLAFGAVVTDAKSEFLGKTVHGPDGEFVVAAVKLAGDESETAWMEDAKGTVGAYSDEVTAPGHEKYGIPGVSDVEVAQAVAKLTAELESPEMRAAILAELPEDDDERNAVGDFKADRDAEPSEATLAEARALATTQSAPVSGYIVGEETKGGLWTGALTRKDGTYFGVVQKPELVGKRRIVTGCAHHHKEPAEALTCAAGLAQAL